MADKSESLERYLKRLNNTIARKASYMSNSKWFKFFDALQSTDIFLPEAVIKFLTDESTYKFSFNSTFEYDYCDGVYGAFSYKEIEWLYIPATEEYERFNRNEKLESRFKEVELSLIIETLDSLGQYEYEYDENGLKIYGYK